MVSVPVVESNVQVRLFPHVPEVAEPDASRVGSSASARSSTGSTVGSAVGSAVGSTAGSTVGSAVGTGSSAGTGDPFGAGADSSTGTGVISGPSSSASAAVGSREIIITRARRNASAFFILRSLLFAVRRKIHIYNYSFIQRIFQ